jgi:LysM repeat protein
MKKVIIALFTAILIAGQFFTPAAAAAPSALQASEDCGDTYVVHRGDWLSKIARYCGTTVSEILARNPQIYNPNWIYPGQVLRLTGSHEEPKQHDDPESRDTHHASVSLSTTRAGVGDKVTVTVSGFPSNVDIDFRIGQKGKSFSKAYDATTNSHGAASKTISIPSSADEGEYWVVRVLTTEIVHGIEVVSSSITITD